MWCYLTRGCKDTGAVTQAGACKVVFLHISMSVLDALGVLLWNSVSIDALGVLLWKSVNTTRVC